MSAQVGAEERKADQIAKASVYADHYHGKPMARGGIFNNQDPSLVAHLRLPIGTKLLLSTPMGSVEACVRDRGPTLDATAINGATYDLSQAAARKLGLPQARGRDGKMKWGIYSIRVSVIGMCEPYEYGKALLAQGE